MIRSSALFRWELILRAGTFWTFGRLLWTGDSSTAKPLPTQENKAQKNTEIYSYFLQDSNPISKRLRVRSLRLTQSLNGMVYRIVCLPHLPHSVMNSDPNALYLVRKTTRKSDILCYLHQFSAESCSESCESENRLLTNAIVGSGKLQQPLKLGCRLWLNQIFEYGLWLQC